MAHVTRIKAHDPAKPRDDDAPKEPKKPVEEAEVIKKPEKTLKPKKAKKDKSEKKKPFILFRPFIAFGCYLRDSWRELRQVRWPNRKTTWKMVLAVFVYTLLVITFLVLVDLLFDWIFSLLLN
ncbi:preprotein translocase subunit SecE [Candidatus Saccharibacteria bacterium]|nr:preprotein translocase subunit SecE [Candidatus Saccharibacteria bacterium]